MISYLYILLIIILFYLIQKNGKKISKIEKSLYKVNDTIDVSKFIYIEPIKLPDTLDEIDKNNNHQALIDIINSIKIENWICTIDPNINYDHRGILSSATYDFKFTNITKTLAFSTSLQYNKKGLNIFYIKLLYDINDKFVIWNLKNTDMPYSSLAILLFEKIKQFNDDENKIRMKDYKKLLSILSKELKIINRDRKLDDLI